jgi:cytochrome c biogenesis protein CcdA
VIDSINPSALVVTLYLLTRERPAPKIAAYIAGIFCVYFGLGLALMLGLGSIFKTLEGAVENPIVYGLQAAIGLTMLIYALFAKADQPTSSRALPTSSKLGAIFVLGMVVTFVELSTALPYLAAIGILLNASLSAAQWLPVLLVYNGIFVLPPLVMLAAAIFGPRAFGKRFASWREKLSRSARETWLWLLGIIGFLLLADAVLYFLP